VGYGEEMKRAILGLAVLSAVMMSQPGFALGKSSKPVWVDSAGKEIGPLAFSRNIAQGVVLHVSVPLVGRGTSSLWILVPFGVDGSGYSASDLGATIAPYFVLQQIFFGGTCGTTNGQSYILSTSPDTLKKNSESKPYSAYMGFNNTVLVPNGTPQLGTALGIGASAAQTTGAFGAQPPTDILFGPCQPAFPAPNEYFVSYAQIDVSTDAFTAQGFQPPPYRLITP
jgi:hypothetical protein